LRKAERRRDALGRKRKRASGGLEGFCDGENQLFFVRAADDLDANRKAFFRMADGDRSAREASQVKPLRKTHGIEIAGTGFVVAASVGKSRRRRNRRKQNRCVSHLAENFCAEKIALGAGFQELIERERIGRTGCTKIFA